MIDQWIQKLCGYDKRSASENEIALRHASSLIQTHGSSVTMDNTTFIHDGTTFYSVTVQNYG